MDRLGGAFGSLEPVGDGHEFEDGYTDDDPPSPVGQDERRMQVRAYNHWASLLGDGTLPDIEDLEPERLDDFGPYSVLLDFSTGIENPAVRFIGSELRKECDATGIIDRLSDVPARSLLSRITDHYMQILANQAPIGFEAEYENQRGCSVMYRGILLPYSSDDETIDFIFGVINWREAADAKTADELLLEIDQSLGEETDTSFDGPNDVSMITLDPSDILPADPASEPLPETGGSYDEVLDLSAGNVVSMHGPGALPTPQFGGASAEFRYADAAEHETPLARRARGFDALGNPIGEALSDEPGANDHFAVEDHSADGDGYDSGMKTAADYGLPEWDDEGEDEDVDGLIDPLADEEQQSSLMSLVSRGEKMKKAVDLGAFEMLSSDTSDDEESSIPQNTEEHDPWAEARANFDAFEEDHSESAEADDDIAADTSAQSDADHESRASAGLHDCLAQARELAQAAQTTEDRSRKTLYAAVGRAYDFSLEAVEDAEGFQEIMADNGLTMQDRAPMTPVVKLVFGSDYDKTRLTEYAAVLSHAHRVGVARGALGSFLRDAEGGLKGIVQAERRARKEEQGKPIEETGETIREKLARKLRKLGGFDFSALGTTGPEFALVMVRRTDDGRLIVIGELPEDRAALEKAGRALLAK
ncbi:PAS domain-containing protein [Erythrobacter litoralis]|uniref:PAS domain-containing protein n=1 Tax=Erythrobacter litoralis TaxID=39960 RepID=UPI003D6FAE95